MPICSRCNSEKSLDFFSYGSTIFKTCRSCRYPRETCNESCGGDNERPTTDIICTNCRNRLSEELFVGSKRRYKTCQPCRDTKRQRVSNDSKHEVECIPLGRLKDHIYKQVSRVSDDEFMENSNGLDIQVQVHLVELS